MQPMAEVCCLTQMVSHSKVEVSVCLFFSKVIPVTSGQPAGVPAPQNGRGEAVLNKAWLRAAAAALGCRMFCCFNGALSTSNKRLQTLPQHVD
jgi:hypothetical protein